MSVLEIKVYEMFKTRFFEQEASLVIEYLDAKKEEKIQQKRATFLTKDDKVELV